MSGQRIRAVSGSCLGSVLGGVLGVLLGYVITIASVESHIEEQEKAGDPFVGFYFCFGGFAALFGTGVGGIVGAITGATLGAGVATLRSQSAPAEDQPPAASATADQSTDTELARLRERIAELEKKKTSGASDPNGREDTGQESNGSK